jgi:hypothetical protein
METDASVTIGVCYPLEKIGAEERLYVDDLESCVANMNGGGGGVIDLAQTGSCGYHIKRERTDDTFSLKNPTIFSFDP